MSGHILQSTHYFTSRLSAQRPCDSGREGENWAWSPGRTRSNGQDIQSDIEAEEQSSLSLLADFFHLDVAIDSESAEGDVMATVQVQDDKSGEETAPQSILSLTNTQPMTVSNEDFTVNGLRKSYLVQNLTKKTQVPSGPLLPSAPLPFPILCLHRAFPSSTNTDVACNKVLQHHLSSKPHTAPCNHSYTAHHHTMLDVDPSSGLSFPSCVPFVYDLSAAPDALYSQ